MDGAIATVNSNALKFLQERGVEVVHGMPNMSKCQSKIERQIGSVMWLVCKLQTADQRLPFAQILSEADCYKQHAINGIGTISGTAGRTFRTRTIGFPTSRVNERLQRQQSDDCRTRGKSTNHGSGRDETPEERKMTSPTDYTSKLKISQLCLRKRTVFPTSSPKKLCYKGLVNGYKIISKVVTNHFRVRSVVNGKETTLPGDALVKVSALTEQELVELCNEMEKATV